MPFLPRSLSLLGMVSLFNLSVTTLGGTLILPLSPTIAQEVMTQNALNLVYPPLDHQTTADRIFLIGTAPPQGTLTINNQSVHQSPAGHFAPSFPLVLGENRFSLRYEVEGRSPQTLELQVTRIAATSPPPTGLAFADGSLFPPETIARQPGEWICLSAIAAPQGEVEARLSNGTGQNYTIALAEASQPVTLPPNSAVLTKDNAPQAELSSGHYQGCGQLLEPGTYQVNYHLSLQNQSLSATAPGIVDILNPQDITIATVTAESGTARTGPSTDYSRLTPLPPGTHAQVTGKTGEWLRLDYGAWIKAAETRLSSSRVLPHSLLRSVLSRTQDNWTEIVFPLEVPVPITVTQAANTFSLTLHNTIAQTDTIYISPDPIVQGFTWQQNTPTQVTYQFQLQGSQQWGYKLRYEGTQLILSLKHPPQVRRGIEGLRIFLDPGHGSENDLGARGPTGYPEKDVTLKISQQLAAILRQRGAIVSLSREGDDDLWPNDRTAMINTQEPDLALSLHYNALPDQGDAENTQGIGTFWYQEQSAGLAQFLHDYLVETLDRPSYGVFWNNLALTRPSVTPAILLELGFMINPEEFEWIMNEKSQAELVLALADGIENWFQLVQKIP
ncbi:MAG: N-acetylmuramoyl-L-alanine amidase [Prochlorotrichaceae cyanobacterium]